MATKLCCMFFTHYVKFPGFLYSVCYIKRKDLQVIGNILFPPVTMSIPMYTCGIQMYKTWLTWVTLGVCFN